MITLHYPLLRQCHVDIHRIVDDFGNETSWNTDGSHYRAWAAAYRFANGQTFEQAGMRSIGVLVAEH